ncbi:MAG: pYEATS domain-containing protein [Nannocystaceae bacterium]
MSEGVDLTAIRRSSQRAGLVSLLGALLIFAGLGYSAWRLVGLQAEVEAVEGQIAELTPVRDELAREKEALSAAREALAEDNEELTETRTKLELEIASLRAERDRLRDGYREVAELAESRDAPRLLKQELRERAPLSAFAQPRAASSAVDGERSVFAAWIEFPEAQREQVAAVAYVFNHPSFRQKAKRSTDRAANFRVEYTGWGCLDSVVAEIERVDGGAETLHFDMCALLRERGEATAREPSILDRRVEAADPGMITQEPRSDRRVEATTSVPTKIEPGAQPTKTPTRTPTKSGG